MKKSMLTVIFLVAWTSVYSQGNDQIVAITSEKKYTTKDLKPETLEIVKQIPEKLNEIRLELLKKTISETLIEEEAKLRRISPERLINQIKAKAKKPSETEITKTYEANRDYFRGKSIEETKPEIVEFLTSYFEKEALEKYLESLRRKFKVNIPTNFPSGLNHQDTMIRIGSRKITLAEFEKRNSTFIQDAKSRLYDQLYELIEEQIFNDLANTEAKSQGITTDELIAREVTNKIEDFSEVENEFLYAKFRKAIFSKYKVKIIIENTDPSYKQISTDENPSKGDSSASVTLVMFSDFQCPACAAIHPIIQQIIDKYNDKVRFVVKNFPLERHKDALLAAKAAKAAERQGKFFEYIEILYKNQKSLDVESLKLYAKSLGLDIKKFETDLSDEKIAESIKRDVEEGKKLGVKATPTIFVNGAEVYSLNIKGIIRAIEKALERL